MNVYTQQEAKVLCSLGIGSHADLLAIAEPTYQAYADRHGYSLVLGERPLTLERPAAWSKILLILRLLGEYGLIVWVDSDAIIVDTTVDIASVTDGDHFCWMVEHHSNVQDEPLFNSGVMAIRSCPEAVAFFEAVWEQPRYIEHPWWEQAAILDMLGFRLDVPGKAVLTTPTPWYGKIGKLPTEWNSMPLHDPHPAPRIKHFSGTSLDDRLKGMFDEVMALRASGALEDSHEKRPVKDYTRAAGSTELQALSTGESDNMRPSSVIHTVGEASFIDGEYLHSTNRRGVSVIIPIMPGAPEPQLASLATIASSGLSDLDEVIIVDDCSRLNGLFPVIKGAEIIRCAQPFGLAHAWQIGWERASHDIVVLMAQPARPLPGWLDKIEADLEDPEVMMVGVFELREKDSTLMHFEYPQPGLMHPSSADVLAVRRRDLANVQLPIAGSAGVEGAVLCQELGIRNYGAAIHPPLHLAKSLLSMPPPPDAAAIPPWSRWTYGWSLATIPCREEIPFVLNARGLTGTAVKVGVQHGLFSAHILTHWEGKKLISADPWEAEDQEVWQDVANQPQDVQDSLYKETLLRLSVYGDRSEVWKMRSTDAAAKVPDDSLDFVYIDARHDYESVMEDIKAWFPKVRPGGVVAGHYYLDGDPPEGKFGVRQAVDEFFAGHGLPVSATMADPPWLSWLVEKPKD